MSPNSDSSAGLRPGPSPLTPQLPGELEAAHHSLLEQQDQVEDDRELLAAAESLISEARGIGATLEDPQVRKRCQSILDYWAVFIYRADRKDVDAELLPFDPSQSTALEDIEFPYDFSVPPGDGQDLPLQGWRRLLDECERDLAQFHFLTVVSDPGSGGRTLVHKLLLPTLRGGRARRDELAGSDQWRYYAVTFRDQPLRELLTAIALQDGRDQVWVAEQQAEIQSDHEKLLNVLKDDSKPPAVLVFSRFNRLLRIPDAERGSVCRALDHLIRDPQQRFFTIATLARTDATQLTRFGPLEQRLRDGHVLLALTTAELRHFIEEPARRVGLVFEPGLIDQLLIDIQGESTAVPLLQFTLKRLWDRRERNRITWQAYEQTGAGTVAVGRAIDALYDDLTPEQQIALRHVLLSMVILEPGADFRPTEVLRAELAIDDISPADLDAVIERLQQQDLLYESASDGQVEYALPHRSLLTSWRPLVGWLDELRVSERFRLRLKESAEHWTQRGKPSDLVWRGAMLMEADEEIDDDQSLSTAEREFLAAGRRREAGKRRRRWAVAGLVVTSIMIILFAVPTAQRKMETKQRMYGNAVDSLRQGDLAGELLWLDAYDEVIDLPHIGSAGLAPDIAAEMRKLAERQLPDLSEPRFATEQESADNYSAADRSKLPRSVDMAVETFKKQSWLAAIRRRVVAADANSETYEFTAYVQSLQDDAKLRPLKPTFTRPTPAGGSIGFIRSESEPPVLIAAGNGLHCWQLAGEETPQWKERGVLFRPANTAVAPAAISVSIGGELLLTNEPNPSSKLPKFRMWQIDRSSADSRLTLTELTLPQSFRDAKVRSVTLGENGSLIGLCSPDGGLATELMVWSYEKRNDAAGQWDVVLSPSWVPSLHQSDPQRLYDWGWEPISELGQRSAADQPSKRWRRIESSIRAVAFSPSGNRFVTACGDGQILVWNANRAVVPLMESELQLGSSVFDVKFLNENVIITGGRDRTARMWNIHSGAEVESPTYHEGTVTGVGFIFPDRLVTNTQRQIRVWHSDTYQQTLSPILVNQLAISEDQHHAVYLQRGNADIGLPPFLESSNLATKEDDADWDIQKIAISENGTWQCTLSRRNGQNAWTLRYGPLSETKTDAENSKLPLEHTISGTKQIGSDAKSDPPMVQFSTSEQWLAAVPSEVSEKNPGKVYLLDPARTERELEELTISVAAGESFTFNQLAFATQNSWEMLAIVGEVQYSKTAARPASKMGCVHLAVRDSDQDPPSWRLYRLKLGGDREPVDPHQEEALCVAFSSDGQSLATGDAHDRVKLWNVEELLNKVESNATQGPDGVTAITVKGPIGPELKHSSNVDHLVFGTRPGNQNRTRLATISSEGEASMWSLAEGGRTSRLEYKLKHDAKILTLRFSPDRRWIVTGGEDRTARVWDTNEGKLVGIFKHAGAVEEAWYDEDHLLTASRSPTIDANKQPALQIRYWSDPTKELTLSSERLRAMAARQLSGDTMSLEILELADN